MNEFDNSEEMHYIGTYAAVVTDTADPEMLGRVRFEISGLIAHPSPWAYPFGGPGGGTAARGWFDVPDKGAEVLIVFHQGNIDVPFYTPAHWGFTDLHGSEIPTPVLGVPPKDAHLVKAYETSRYQMVFDGRSGSEVFKVLDKVTGDLIAMDPANGITLKSAQKVVVDAPKIYLGGDNLSENPVTGDGIVTAKAVDTFTGNTQGALKNASTIVFAKKS